MNEISVTRFRYCRICGLLKPATSDFFGLHPECKDGLTPRCKSCMGLRQKAHYYRDIEKSRESGRRYRLTSKIGGRSPVPVVCYECGKSFTSNPSRIANGKDKYCSKACYHAFNRVRVEGDVIYIELTTQLRELLAETKVDTADLGRIRAAGGRLFAEVDEYSGHRAWIRADGEAVFLHRFIMNAPDGKFVDHINHDALDNRKSNLRLVNYSQNNQNRRGPNKNSKSGVRNVHWIEEKQKWCVKLMVNRKVVNVGRFKELADAEAAAIEARRRYMTHAEL